MSRELDILLTALYVFIDDHVVPPRAGRGRRPDLSDSELITLAVAQVLLGLRSGRRWIRQLSSSPAWPAMFPHLPRQPGHHKRLKNARPLLCKAIPALAAWCPSWFDDMWMTDATAVPCGTSRETVKRSDLAGYAGHGYCASYSRYFRGFRLYLVCAGDGMPVMWCLANPKTGEREVVAALLEHNHHLIRAGQVLLADKGFAGQEFKQLTEAMGLCLPPITYRLRPLTNFKESLILRADQRRRCRGAAGAGRPALRRPGLRLPRPRGQHAQVLAAQEQLSPVHSDMPRSRLNGLRAAYRRADHGVVDCEVARLAHPRRGHFDLGTGFHGNVWLNLDALFLRPALLRPHIRWLAGRLREHQADAICGPLEGGAFLAQAIADVLGTAFLPAYRSPGTGPGRVTAYRLPRVPGGLSGWRVAIADDAVNAGTAVRACSEQLRDHGAIPVAVAALLSLGPASATVAETIAVPFYPVGVIDSQAWPAARCPLCASGVPRTDPGLACRAGERNLLPSSDGNSGRGTSRRAGDRPRIRPGRGAGCRGRG